MNNVPWNTVDQDKPVMSGIDEKLRKLLDARRYQKPERPFYDEVIESNIEAIKQAFIAWVEQDIIGEDENPRKKTHMLVQDSNPLARNELRAEQRKKLRA